MIRGSVMKATRGIEVAAVACFFLHDANGGSAPTSRRAAASPRAVEVSFISESMTSFLSMKIPPGVSLSRRRPAVQVILEPTPPDGAN